MSTLFIILMLLAMAAVVVSLIMGVFFMSKGDDESKHKSNKFMRLRVVLQGMALIFFALAVMSGAGQ